MMQQSPDEAGYRKRRGRHESEDSLPKAAACTDLVQNSPAETGVKSETLSCYRNYLAPL